MTPEEAAVVAAAHAYAAAKHEAIAAHAKAWGTPTGTGRGSTADRQAADRATERRHTAEAALLAAARRLA